MSDLLAVTGWIGERPVTGADIAHLLLYPATDLDPTSPTKVGGHEAFQRLELPNLGTVSLQVVEPTAIDHPR